MKRTISFNKGFIPCTIISAVIILFGIVCGFTKGINFCLYYKPVLIEEVRVAELVV